ncbi:hypothetical protein GM415_11105 [Pseudodesulfovibrio cashew]|uniref:TadE-like domain-containing protein n=1 Tax=Pseudodesulfovibrio cashew TaxID=2678688 RepID=A0A6I6JKJ4_9BACT|nr:TadE family protein [Pseudodesulfovibrio cashew]QGY40647.1 hypothetical protein GM415_11105 [Pseudodesulfovibrio cashew]
MRGSDTKRQGVAVIEFALIMGLLMVPLMAGVWDVSKFIDINQILTRAAREGVVTASRGDDPTAMVQDYVAQAGLSAAHLTVTVDHGAEVQTLGQEVIVKLAYDFTGETIFPWEDVMPGGVSTSASAKME